MTSWVKRTGRTLGVVLALALVAVNGLAFLHAHAMTHFTPGGTRTAPPDQLSLGGKLTALAGGVRIPRPVNDRTPASFGLAYERDAFPSTDGVVLEAWRIPREAARGVVVLFHGYADSKDSVLREAAAFHAMGYEALLVDFRGCGGSGGDVTTIGFLEAEDVGAALAYARSLPATGPRLLYGVSMGAAAVLRAVGILGARPEAVILQFPFDRLRSTVRHRFEMMGLPAFPASDLLVLWGGLEHGFNGFRHDPVTYARGVSCPALLLQGDADARVRLDEARAIFASLAGPKRMHVFRGLGHQSLLKAQPDEWRAAVTGFLTAP